MERTEYCHATCFLISTPSISKQQISNKMMTKVDHFSMYAGIQKKSIRDKRIGVWIFTFSSDFVRIGHQC